MRPTSLALAASALLLGIGAIAAGCVSNNAVTPPGEDASVSFDAGSLDVATSPVDATTDATLDAAVPSTLDFGLVNCGTGTATKTYSVTNTTAASITYAASVPTGSVFSITSGASATVAPGASGSITLAVSAIPTMSAAGTPLTSTLTVTSNLPGATTVSVPLKVTPQGGSITVSPAPAAFGQVQLAYGGTIVPLTITNAGNAPVTLTFGAPTEPDGGIDPAFGLVFAGSSADASVTIAAGGSLPDAEATFVPTAPGADSVTLPIQTTSPLCASATGIAMTGTGTTAQVTVGPSPLQFGLVPCGDAGGPLQVTVTNSSPGPVGFTAALGLGASSPFLIDPADGGTVPGFSGSPGTAVITVTPKPIPVPASIDAGAFNDTLLVTPLTPFVPATPIALEESAEGAILAVTVADGGAFGTVVAPEGALTVTVTNTGNMDAPLNYAPNPAVVDAGTFFAGGATSAPADGGQVSGVVQFQPAANASASTSLTVSTTAPLCAAPPPAIPITATGEIPVASFSSTPIALGSTCGAGAGTQGSVTITNTGQGPLVIESAASTSGAFTIVSALPMTILPTQSASLVVAGASVGQGTASGTVLTDTLSFYTNEISTQVEPRTVPVTLTLSGANLSYVGLSGNTLNITTCGGSYTVQNTGNVDAMVIGGGTYPSDAPFNFGDTFSASGTPVVTAGGTQTDNVSTNLCNATKPCSLTAASPQSFTTSSAADAGPVAAGICIPLPPLTVELNLPNLTETCSEQCCT